MPRRKATEEAVEKPAVDVTAQIKTNEPVDVPTVVKSIMHREPLKPGQHAIGPVVYNSLEEYNKQLSELVNHFKEWVHATGSVFDFVRFNKQTRQETITKHVLIDGWTYLANLVGLSVLIKETTFDRTEREAKATAILLDPLTGQVYSQAEMICSGYESMWKFAPDFAIISMAQTRASARVVRALLGWIVKMADFSTTPGEEMQGISSSQNDDDGDNGAGRRVVKNAPPAKETEEDLQAAAKVLKDQVAGILKAHNMTMADFAEMAKEIELPGADPQLAAETIFAVNLLLGIEEIPDGMGCSAPEDSPYPFKFSDVVSYMAGRK